MSCVHKDNALIFAVFINAEPVLVEAIPHATPLDINNGRTGLYVSSESTFYTDLKIELLSPPIKEDPLRTADRFLSSGDPVTALALLKDISKRSQDEERRILAEQKIKKTENTLHYQAEIHRLEKHLTSVWNENTAHMSATQDGISLRLSGPAIKDFTPLQQWPISELHLDTREQNTLSGIEKLAIRSFSLNKPGTVSDLSPLNSLRYKNSSSHNILFTIFPVLTKPV